MFERPSRWQAVPRVLCRSDQSSTGRWLHRKTRVPFANYLALFVASVTKFSRNAGKNGARNGKPFKQNRFLTWHDFCFLGSAHTASRIMGKCP